MVKIVFSLKKAQFAFAIISSLILVSVGIHAYASSTSATPSVMGHTFNEIETPLGCDTGEYLIRYGTVWTCLTPGEPPIVCTGTNYVLQWDGGEWSCVKVNI